jgi:hypothetical protein
MPVGIIDTRFGLLELTPIKTAKPAPLAAIKIQHYLDKCKIWMGIRMGR